MPSEATPHNVGSVYIANGRQHVKQDSTIVQDAWANELRHRVHLVDKSLDWYLDHLVPCAEPYLPSVDLKSKPGPFAQYQPKAGGEVASYPGLLAGLKHLVSSFVASKRLTFASTHGTPLPFPFSSFASNHHLSKPDMAASFPGETLDESMFLKYPWRDISFVFEVKPEEKDDPFYDWKRGDSNDEKIIQVARNGRNLMLANGFLASFVIGIYGEYGRFVRFDHTCALVSRRFNIKKEPDILQRFFWHFVNPRVGTTVVGADPTITKLSVIDREWVKNWLEKRGEDLEGFETDALHGRRIEVYDEQSGATSPWIVYKPVDVNARLFSRATTVWRAIEDTRLRRGSRYMNSRTADPPRLGILKESWRQVVRQSEASFYHRLASKIPDDERFGLTKLLCGADLGQADVRNWEMWSDKTDLIRDYRDLRMSSSPAPSTPSSTSPYPLPYPLHQTFSWTIAMGPDMTYRERSHMRFVVADVGRSPDKFKNTKELVSAFRDAICGHQQAWERAGILHRDVSIGNILIVDKPREGSFMGFIHDFDYSSVEEEDESVPHLVDDMPLDDADDEAHETAVVQKERTGTYYFMAMAFLIMATHQEPVFHDVHHDLESFYWVLLWIVLRHTEHSLGQSRCETVFKYGNDQDAWSAKEAWLGSPYTDKNDAWKLNVTNNEPLTVLMREFRLLVRKQAREGFVLEYDIVLALFDKVLAMEGWPSQKDWVPCMLLAPKQLSLVHRRGLVTPKHSRLLPHRHTLGAMPIPPSPGTPTPAAKLKGDVRASFRSERPERGPALPSLAGSKRTREPIDELPELDSELDTLRIPGTFPESVKRRRGQSPPPSFARHMRGIHRANTSTNSRIQTRDEGQNDEYSRDSRAIGCCIC
ncbi:hypothetical protein C8Q76DRAFT_696735 [Earliella scabrosa]|nr:hypothetical protein C8Q76DRAFT_696735 [Earliella scabrosa]